MITNNLPPDLPPKTAHRLTFQTAEGKRAIVYWWQGTRPGYTEWFWNTNRHTGGPLGTDAEAITAGKHWVKHGPELPRPQN